MWGRGAYSSFSGQDSDVTLDGELTTAMLGADYAAGRWIAGVSLSVSEGEGTYGLDGKEGELDSSLTGFYPYVGYDISERLSAWGVAGYGEGNIKLTLADTTETIRTGIDLAMVAVGAARRPHVADGGGGLRSRADLGCADGAHHLSGGGRPGRHGRGR